MSDERALIHLLVRDDAGPIKIHGNGWKVACKPDRKYDFGTLVPGKRLEQVSNYYPAVNCDKCLKVQTTDPAEH